jgi:AcrR family transcriptional regulator
MEEGLERSRQRALSASTASGRSRGSRTRQKVLIAAWELYESVGLVRLTIEQIAQYSGVAKTTIYRQWPNKTAVLVDALNDHLDPMIAFADTGSAREDLQRQLTAVITVLTRTSAGTAYLAVIAESQHNPELAVQLQERFIASRRTAATDVLLRGIARGELRSDLDIGIALDAFYGAIYYRLMISRAPTDNSYAGLLLEQFYRALN